MNNRQGFTLIELLVSVIIIAVLSGSALVVLNPLEIRRKARDTQRVSDVKKIQTALEQYYLKYRGYPATTGGAFIKVDNTGLMYNSLVAGANNFIEKVPEDTLLGTNSDPCTDTTSNRYNYKASARTGSATLADKYVLTAIMETKTANDGYECGALLNWGNSCSSSAPTPPYNCPDNFRNANTEVFSTCEVCYGLENK